MSTFCLSRPCSSCHRVIVFIVSSCHRVHRVAHLNITEGPARLKATLEATLRTFRPDRERPPPQRSNPPEIPRDASRLTDRCPNRRSAVWSTNLPGGTCQIRRAEIPERCPCRYPPQ